MQAEGGDARSSRLRQRRRLDVLEEDELDELDMKVEEAAVKTEVKGKVEEVAEAEGGVLLVDEGEVVLTEEEEEAASAGVDGGDSDPPASPHAASPAAGRAARGVDGGDADPPASPNAASPAAGRAAGGVDGGDADPPASPHAASPAAGRAAANQSHPRRSPRMEVGLGLGKLVRPMPDPTGAIDPRELPTPAAASALASSLAPAASSAAAASGSGSASTTAFRRPRQVAGLMPLAARCLNI